MKGDREKGCLLEEFLINRFYFISFRRVSCRMKKFLFIGQLAVVNSDDRTFSINRKRKKMARDGKGRDEKEYFKNYFSV